MSEDFSEDNRYLKSDSEDFSFKFGEEENEDEF